MKKAFEHWLASEQGLKCNSPLSNPQQPFLMNRLWWAYQAGLNGIGADNEIKELRQELIKRDREIYDLKKFINKLTKERATNKKQHLSKTKEQ